MNVNSRTPKMNIGPIGPIGSIGSNINRNGSVFASNSVQGAGSGVIRYILIAAVIAALVILVSMYYTTIVQYIWGVPGSPQVQPEQASLQSVVNTIEADVETALGTGNEVFNISRNIYSFNDAEPLCKAFGAELATYDQVKEAYEKGADWCNYGWAKGQLALYPTQEDTWNKLQEGPEEQRMSCGHPGVNGGSFTNPDQQFGVNCYGRRPARTALDDQVGKAPETPFDRSVAHFKHELDSIPVTPWNVKQWSQ